MTVNELESRVAVVHNSTRAKKVSFSASLDFDVT